MADFILISNTSDMLRLWPDEILCVESEGNYSNIVLDGGDRRTVTVQLGELGNQMETQLGSARSPFVRVGRSLIVNIDHIRYINPGKQSIEVVGKDGKVLKFGASKSALIGLKIFLEEQFKASLR